MYWGRVPGQDVLETVISCVWECVCVCIRGKKHDPYVLVLGVKRLAHVLLPFCRESCAVHVSLVFVCRCAGRLL